MKVLVVVDGIWPGAVEVSGIKTVYELQKELVVQGVDVSILTLIEKWTAPGWRKWFKKQTLEHGIKFFYLKSRWQKFPRLYLYLNKILIFSRALKILREGDFDILHEYSSSPLLINRTWALGKLTGVKTVHTLCTHNRGLLSSGKWALGRPDKVICVGQKMQKDFNCAASYPADCLPLGISFKKFLSQRSERDYRQELKIPKASPLVLYVGLLDERKGIFDFLKIIPKVLKKYPQTFFLIATRSQVDVLPQYLANKKTVLESIRPYQKNVRFIEGKHDVPPLLQSSDIFVFPLTTFYGTLGVPILLIEALGCGKVVVASRLPQTEEFVEGGVTGLLYKNDSEFAAQVGRLVGDLELRQRLGEKAAVEAKKYNLLNIVKELVGIYEKLSFSKNN